MVSRSMLFFLALLLVLTLPNLRCVVHAMPSSMMWFHWILFFFVVLVSFSSSPKSHDRMHDCESPLHSRIVRATLFFVEAEENTKSFHRMLCHSPFCWHHLPILQSRHADQAQMGIPIQTTHTTLPQPANHLC